MDLTNFLKDLAGPIGQIASPVAQLIVGVAAANVAWRLGKGQLAVARAQADLADRNWRTSNDKIVLELFDRRYALFQEVRAAVAKVLAQGNARDEDIRAFEVACDRIPYLFGPEVSQYLESVRLRMIDLEVLEKAISIGQIVPSVMDKRRNTFASIAAFYDEAMPLFGAYLQTHQKAAPVASGKAQT